MRVYDTTGPYTDSNVTIDVRQGLARTRRAWVLERGGVEEYDGRPIQADRQRQREDRGAAAVPQHAAAVARASRQADHPVRMGARRRHHQGNDLRRRARESRPQDGARGRPGAAGRRRELRRGAARVHHARVRAPGSGDGPRHHPGQHQPRRARADGDRPQFPGEDQRQHRQLGGLLLDGGRGREDGVGDPLGRRHGHGPVDRPQHPRHARMDRAQFAGADRHRADLPGAGEGRRRSDQALVGGLSRHADRAVRAGRRLLHHPCRRAAGPCAADRQAGHRHRQPRRLDDGAVVPDRASRELPLRAFRRHLRHHAQVRRVVLAGRRPAARLQRRRQRCRAVRRARDPGRAHQDRLGQGLPGHDRGPGPRAHAQDQGQHGQAAAGNAARRRSTPWDRSSPTSRRATTTSPRASAPP